MSSPMTSNFMTDRKQAVFIDIGSNSIRSMQAALEDGRFSFSKKSVYTTRLAEGLVATGCLSDAAMQRSLGVLSDIIREASMAGLPIHAYATSAVRDAKNRDVFLDAVHSAMPALTLEVLPGAMEAALAYRGAVPGGEGLLADIGGGSTQLITGSGGQSYPMGCVRAKDLCAGPSYEDIRSALFPVLTGLIHPPVASADACTFVGGTATTVAACFLGLNRYDSAAVSACRMGRADLDAAIRRLDALGPDGRRQHPLLEKRHDVILPGCAILEWIVDALSIPTLRFSDADGLDGYAMHVLGEC